MTDSLVDRIRASLIINQEASDRILTPHEARIHDLEEQVDLLRHKVKALSFEIAARNASAIVLAEQIEELQKELDGKHDPRPAQDRLDEDGERTYAPNLPDEEE